jgi:hypothetical protein
MALCRIWAGRARVSDDQSKRAPGSPWGSTRRTNPLHSGVGGEGASGGSGWNDSQRCASQYWSIR